MLKTSFGHCIYQSKSGAKVFQNYWYRWLTFNSSALQTVMLRRNPQKPVLNYLAPLCMLAKSTPGNTCVLGLGGASAAHYLSPFTINESILAVENNKDVIDIAKHYFHSEEVKQLKIIHEDAALFLKNDNGLFKHLIIDLYNSHFYPPECNTDEFFLHCKQKLKDNGFLAINLANPEEQLNIYKKVKKQFKHCTVVMPVKSCANMIIFASKTPSFSYITEYIYKSTSVKSLKLDACWGCVLII